VGAIRNVTIACGPLWTVLEENKLKKPKVPPAFTLFVLAPMIGELLSGSAPPTEFFNPIAFVLLASLYGSGAIVVRELKIRWRKDFRAVLLLGAAYGIVEEGLMVKSFFDPEWVDLGKLGSFGRWMGVNWVWVEMLTIYHAVFSVIIPIVLVELAYPERKDERWTSDRSFKSFVALLAAVTAFGFFFLTPYVPPLPHCLSTVFVICLFIYMGYRLPAEKVKAKNESTTKAWSLWIIGLTSTAAFFLIFWLSPHVFNHPITVMVLGILLVFGMLKFLAHFDWNNLNRLAIVGGALSFLIILAPLQELDVTRQDNPAGMTLVGLAAIIGLLLLKRKIRAKVKAYIPRCG
jgi:hypothetical protein